MVRMADVSAWRRTRAFAMLKVRSMCETELSGQRDDCDQVTPYDGGKG